jgi:4-hydroxythreonine-4-phosphate dehydrogenase
MEKRNIRVAITQGDTNGVGFELIFKTFAALEMLELCTPIVYGSPKVATYHRKALNLQTGFTIINHAEDAREGRLNMLTAFDEEVKVDLGLPSKEAGQASLKALNRALDDYKAGLVDVIITNPVVRSNISVGDSFFEGQTKYIEKCVGEGHKALKIMTNDSLRVALVTSSIPLSEVQPLITKEAIISKCEIFANSLKRDFRISNPRIAVLSLNPQAQFKDNLRKEETDMIIPALQELEDKGIKAYGPFAADKFFSERTFDSFDGVLAMYYDQGITPFKVLANDDGVDFTAGLPLVRTSPNHGASYDKAGKGIVNENSFRQAIYMAIDVYRNRIHYDEPLANPLTKLYREKRDDSDKVRFAQPKTQKSADEE